MTTLARALQVSVHLAEKVASAHPASAELRQRQALADFAAFGMFKRAALDPAAISSLQRGLGWGVGLGLPALGVGHALLHDARTQSADVLRDARNQALLTAAGVGGMQALGNMLTHVQNAHPSTTTLPAPTDFAPALNDEQKLAAAIMVDDVLEDAAGLLVDGHAKHAALVELIKHRVDAARLLRSMIA